ncbi:DNA/RNA non-specific endonuclease [Paraburkholderia sp. UCT31]|uniref:DNA/RNA non-specific endonuclease n=1 Tax=Paraburkholderia sp. UCT31 TaxID=2615209 RepID=UPI001655DAF7|nr:DNA/RNA non-specific endonuclease [Paraburkholderia sp. UCT31]MBC8739807.1 DNA/RNA non-specific endonuclease [Paraburkholderia sp. UCT31]
MKRILGVALLVVAMHAHAGSSCAQFSPNGLEPVLTNQKLAPKARELCFSDFAVLHSGITRTPLWSAEHLTREHLLAAKEEVRTNRFYAEPALPADERAELSDYLHSGFDRGHQAPAGDRWTDASMSESFSLANMAPENPSHNRRLWAHIEMAVRKMALSAGEAYVTTGPLFIGSQLSTIGPDHVFVPTALYKVVYIPSQQLAFAVVAENVATNHYDVKTVHELEALSGISFPGIPAGLKDRRIGGLNGV